MWATLTDLPSYAEWNPFVTRAEGHVREGESIQIRVEPTGSRPVTMRATLTVVDPLRTLEWVGKLPIPGLFTGRHTFELEALDDGRTRPVNREHASGLLVPFVVPKRISADYDAMNRALADRPVRLVGDPDAPV